MQQVPSPRLALALRIILALVALVAIVAPALIVAYGPRAVAQPRRRALAAARVVPRAELPPVEPVEFQRLAPEDARTFNASVPFVTDRPPAARPFVLRGTAEDLARATDCLAAAVLYEAGDDAIGEQAVAQVVLNRARHPAFPKTICGVVFQGSERTTGCQFTFSCDGALARPVRPEAWLRARDIAVAALGGKVYAPVGYATHYHTDWVVPYWSASLDKIAAVHTHLFFRWTGWWGTGAAFNRTVQPGEPAVLKLAALSPAHRIGALAGGVDALALDPALAGNADARPVIESSNAFLLTIDRGATPAGMTALVQRICGDRAYCKLLGWTNAAQRPTAMPLTTQQMAAMSFSYLRDRATGFEKALWNCTEFPRTEPQQCMKVQVFVPQRVPDGFRLEALANSRPVAVDAGVRQDPAPTPRPVAAPSRPLPTKPADAATAANPRSP